MRVPAALRRARLPRAVLAVLSRLGESGHRSFLVGGAVRDLLLRRGRYEGDFDVATPATPEAVVALFSRVIPTGIAHGTVTVLSDGEPVEVTTFRGEGTYEDGRRPSSVTFHSDLVADLARRDFTMNAIAFDPLLPELCDPFHGRADLELGLVRAVGDAAARFGEDGLRPLRAVRFAAQLGFRLHPKTRGAIPGALEVVRKVSAERMGDEFVKIACAKYAGRGLSLLHRTGLLKVVAPDLEELRNEILQHAGRVAEGLAKDPTLRLAGLLHRLPPDRVRVVLSNLRLSRKVTEEAVALVSTHACRASRQAHLPPDREGVRRWLSKVGRERVPMALALARAEAGSARVAARRRKLLAEVTKLEKEVKTALGAKDPVSTKDLALDGSAVIRLTGSAPGPHVGEALRHLLDWVLAHPQDNTTAALTPILVRWWAGRVATL